MAVLTPSVVEYQITQILRKGNCDKPPGPPPRPGLVWRKTTCRWACPEKGCPSQHDHTKDILDGPVVSKIDWVKPKISVNDKGKSTAYTMSNQVIPPTWSNVWVNKDAKADMQAIGLSQAGNILRLMSPAYNDRRTNAKYARRVAFAKSLPAIRKKCREDFKTSEEAKVLLLIDATGFRIGNKTSDTFGTTTLRGSHASVSGSKITFDFIGKKGVHIKKTIQNSRLARHIVSRKKKFGNDAKLFDTTDGRVRGYMQKAGFGDFMPKDFRTHQATELARKTMKDIKTPKNKKEFKEMKKQVGETVADWLGNTPSVSLGSYIDPKVFRPLEKKLKITKARPDWRESWEDSFDYIAHDFSYLPDDEEGEGIILTDERED